MFVFSISWTQIWVWCHWHRTHPHDFVHIFKTLELSLTYFYWIVGRTEKSCLFSSEILMDHRIVLFKWLMFHFQVILSYFHLLLSCAFVCQKPKKPPPPSKSMGKEPFPSLHLIKWFQASGRCETLVLLDASSSGSHTKD